MIAGSCGKSMFRSVRNCQMSPRLAVLFCHPACNVWAFLLHHTDPSTHGVRLLFKNYDLFLGSSSFVYDACFFIIIMLGDWISHGPWICVLMYFISFGKVSAIVSSKLLLSCIKIQRIRTTRRYMHTHKHTNMHVYTHTHAHAHTRRFRTESWPY